MISTFLTIHFDSMLLTSWYYSSFLELFSLHSHEYLFQTVNSWICVMAASAKISQIYPKESNVTLPHKKHLTLITATDFPLLSSCFMWWCGCSGHDIFELDYTSRVYFLLMMLIKKERIYPFSHIIYMEKNHLVKQNSLPSFQWSILCYDYC